MENSKETSSNVVEFLQKNKTALAVAAGAALAFGVVGYVWRKRARATAAVDEHGYSLDPKFDNNVALYKEEAIKRKKILSNVSYDLVLAVRKGEFFEGHVVISFDVSEEDFDEKDLFIDYHGLGIKGLKINDTEVDSGHAFNGQRIHVAKAHLKLGARNTVSVTFKSKYRNDGTGFHHFVDSEDNNEYVYTQFEAFNAHRAFPCFDQPDLRAELSLKTLAPKDWIVLSNGLEWDILTKGDEKFDEVLIGIAQEFVDRYTDGFNLQLYNTTPAIATYLYAFIAGPFEFIETNEMIPGRKDPLRMRLYCRKTLKKDMERIQKYMFEPVVLAINWYSEFFGYNYPYEKYDQIFCPEFKFGAMENVGCVTFTERLLFRGKEMTERDITSLINVALHELCHHWFGDLVTMTWWNDLWLNESFATYVSFLCMASVKTLFKQCPNLWVNVNSYKNWGYAEDDLSTGHPICKQAPHTDSADDMINGITYGKGCSFLKQLFHLIGYDTFSRATQIYFEKYQWKNTVLKNFLEWLDQANEELPKKTPGIVVSEWANTFLNTRGANVFEGKIVGDTLVITQIVSEFSDGLRQQKIDVLLFDDKLNETVKTIITSEDDPVTKLQLDDKNKRFFILNHGDHAYGKIILSEETSAFLSKDLSKVKDTLTRALVWKAIQGMVKTLKIKSTVYFDFVKNNMPLEDQQMLIETVLTTAGMLIEIYVPDDKYEAVASDMFECFYHMLWTEKRKELIPVLTNSLLGFVKSQSHVEKAVKWLEEGCILEEEKGAKIEGAELSKTHKYAIVKAVHAKKGFDTAEKQRLLDLVVGDDKSDIAKNLILCCEALLPNAAAKQSAWDKIVDHKNKYSSYERQALMDGFFSRDAADVLGPFFDKYVQQVRACADIGNKEFVEAFIGHTCPCFNVTDAFLESLKKVAKEFENDVSHESFCRNVNKVVGSLEINQKIKVFASE